MISHFKKILLSSPKVVTMANVSITDLAAGGMNCCISAAQWRHLCMCFQICGILVSLCGVIKRQDSIIKAMGMGSVSPTFLLLGLHCFLYLVIFAL